MTTSVLHPVSAFVDGAIALNDSTPTDWYQGCSPAGEWLKLPRTKAVEAIAHGLMQQLARDDRAAEGKMYGVLLVDAAGELHVLKAFSGLLQGDRTVPGWVPPIPGREQVSLAEALTLKQLESIKQDLIALHNLPERLQYQARSQEFAHCLQQLTTTQQQQKQARQAQRQILLSTLSGNELEDQLADLDRQSQQAKGDRRRLQQAHNAVLHPLQQVIDQADAQMRQLKQQRKALSQQLQAQMHTAYYLTNFAGASRSLQTFLPTGLPTGTGECCAPKLLHYAASQGLQPIALAEFWWGATQGDKVQGRFYGACAERCQPLMGFLLAGLAQNSLDSSNLPIVYQDDWLIAVNKPAGLLSVPGRSRDRQDSVLTRLRRSFSMVKPVHRLDQDTSGILLLARDHLTERALAQQFHQRQVHKVYEAVLAGVLAVDQGAIDLPIGANFADRPRQRVDFQQGKPSLTQFRVLHRTANTTRVELLPITGRTHQLRVHAAAGLGLPIVGDRLYGDSATAQRLHLHARELQVQHPRSREFLSLKTETPF